MTTPSQVPVRFPSGVSTDQKWGPLADYGLPNPGFYHTLWDDLDIPPASNGLWTQVKTGTGAALAAVAGADGGQWLFTTGSTAANATTMEAANASFVLPPQTYSGTGLTATNYPSKKVFFLARINVTSITAVGVNVGLVNYAATPVNTFTDGIYININNTAANMYAYNGSTLQWTVPIPSAVLTAYYANASWLDVGFYMDRQQNVYAMMGYPLVGWLPASAWSGTNNVNATPVPKAAVAAQQNVYNGTIVNAWTPTTAVLTPTVQAYSLGAASSTMYCDFVLAAKER